MIISTNADAVRAILRQTTAKNLTEISEAGAPPVSKKDLRAYAEDLVKLADGEGPQAMLDALDALGKEANAAVEEATSENAMSPEERKDAWAAYEEKKAASVERFEVKAAEISEAIKGLEDLVQNRGRHLGQAASLRASIADLEKVIRSLDQERETFAAELEELERGLEATAEAKSTIQVLNRQLAEVEATRDRMGSAKNPFTEGEVEEVAPPIPFRIMNLFGASLKRMVADSQDTAAE